MRSAILAFGMPGGVEWIIFGVVMLLLFGRRLPDVARSIGKSIVEFKKGVHDITEDIDDKSRLDAPKQSRIEPSTGSSALPSKNGAEPGGTKNDA